jgi:hypothetical protein
MNIDMNHNDFFKIGQIINIVHSAIEYEEGNPIFMIYIEHVFNDPENNIYFEIVTDKGLLVSIKTMNLAYIPFVFDFIKTDKVITQAPEFLEKVAPNLRTPLLKLINDKKLELDEIITLNNDLNAGEIIEYNDDSNIVEYYGKVLFLIYISSQTHTDDNGNAIPILGEKDLPTLYLLVIFDTGRIRANYDKTAKNLFLSSDKYKITHKLIQDNPELLDPVPENYRRKIFELIEQEKSEQQSISQSQKLPKGGRKRKSTFFKGGAKRYTFRKSGAKRYTIRKSGAKRYTIRKHRKIRKDQRFCSTFSKSRL